jgi:hypothetical protein
MKKVAILQSCYIPWKGYFDIINAVDEFILFDDCQYTRQDWRNRNRIKTARGTRWLTVPVRVDGLYTQRLDETVIADPGWYRRHWDILRQAYQRAPCYRDFADDIADVYTECRDKTRLSEINRAFIEAVCRLLGIGTRLSWSTDYDAKGTREQRVVELCRQAGGALYVSGPRAKAYLDESLFREVGIELRYVDYSGYPEYPQLYPPFEHRVSIVDLLFNAGRSAKSLMKSFSAASSIA